MVFGYRQNSCFFTTVHISAHLKDNLDDIAISDNYRAIAIGSLILKWFDWLILILNSDKRRHFKETVNHLSKPLMKKLLITRHPFDRSILFFTYLTDKKVTAIL